MVARTRFLLRLARWRCTSACNRSFSAVSSDTCHPTLVFFNTIASGWGNFMRTHASSSHAHHLPQRAHTCASSSYTACSPASRHAVSSASALRRVASRAASSSTIFAACSAAARSAAAAHRASSSARARAASAAASLSAAAYDRSASLPRHCFLASCLIKLVLDASDHAFVLACPKSAGVRDNLSEARICCTLSHLGAMWDSDTTFTTMHPLVPCIMWSKWCRDTPIATQEARVEYR